MWVIGRDRLNRVPVRSCRRGTGPRMVIRTCGHPPQYADSTGSRAPGRLTDVPREGAIRRTHLARSCCTATRRPRVAPAVASQASVRVTSARRMPHSLAPVPRRCPTLASRTTDISPEPDRRHRVTAAPFELISPFAGSLVRTPVTLLYVHLSVCQGGNRKLPEIGCRVPNNTASVQENRAGIA